MSEAPTDNCEVCGSVNYVESDDGKFFCVLCQTESQKVVEVGLEHAHLSQSKQSIKVVKKTISTDTKLNSERLWTTIDAYNIILKNMVDILIRKGVNPVYKDIMFQLWVTYLQQTHYAFHINKVSGEEWTPKVPPRPVERDEQVILKNKSVIELTKYRKHYRQTMTPVYKERRKMLKKLKRDKKKDLQINKVEKKSKIKDDDENELEENGQKTNPKNKRRKKGTGGVDEKKIVKKKQKSKSKPNKSRAVKSVNFKVESIEADEDCVHNEDNGELVDLKKSRKRKNVHDCSQDESDTEIPPKQSKSDKRTRECQSKSNSNKYRKVTQIKVAHMSMTRVFEFLYLGLLLLNNRVLLCDLMKWFENSELPLREGTFLLPEDMRFQAGDWKTFFMKTCPNHFNLRNDTGKLARFLLIRSLPVKSLPEIVARFITELNLPNELGLLVIKLIDLIPPVVQWKNDSISRTQRRTMSIPNYEGKAMAYIIVVLKLLLGLDGKTESKQSKFSRKLAFIFPEVDYFNWQDWVLSTKIRAEIHQKKILVNNLSNLNHWTDTKHLASYFINVGSKLKGKAGHKYVNYVQNKVRDPVRNPIQRLVCDSGTEIDDFQTNNQDSVFTINTRNFRNSTLVHLINPQQIQIELAQKNIELKIQLSSAWTRKKGGNHFVVHQPFTDYSYFPAEKYNFLATSTLSQEIVWLLDFCSFLTQMKSDDIYDEILSIERKFKHMKKT